MSSAAAPHFSLPFRFGISTPLGGAWQDAAPSISWATAPKVSWQQTVMASAGPAAVNEQDSPDEIADCVYAVLVCPQGFRVELPAFGLPDPTFAMPAPDLDAIRDAIETWEPRAALVLDGHPDAIDELLAHVETYVQIRSEA